MQYLVFEILFHCLPMLFRQLLYILPLLTNIPYMKFTFIACSVHTAEKQCYLLHGTAICRTCLANPVTDESHEDSCCDTNSGALPLTLSQYGKPKRAKVARRCSMTVSVRRLRHTAVSSRMVCPIHVYS